MNTKLSTITTFPTIAAHIIAPLTNANIPFGVDCIYTDAINYVLQLFLQPMQRMYRDGMHQLNTRDGSHTNERERAIFICT